MEEFAIHIGGVSIIFPVSLGDICDESWMNLRVGQVRISQVPWVVALDSIYVFGLSIDYY